MMTGDFNIDLLQIDERTQTQKYFDLFGTRGFFPKITMPTTSSRFNASLIDQMYCKLDNPDLHSISCIIKTIISNHYPYFTLLDIIKKKNKQPKYAKMSNVLVRKSNIPWTMWTGTQISFMIQITTMVFFKESYPMQRRNTWPQELWNLTDTSAKFHPGRHQEFCTPSSIAINFARNWNLLPLILRCIITWNTTWTHTVIFLKMPENQTWENWLLLTPIW